MGQAANVEKENLIDVCIRLEEAAGDFYRALAVAHRHIPALAAVWARTAADEENHAFQFRMSPRTIDDMISRFKVSEEEVREALGEMEALRDLARKSSPEPEHALRTAIKAEAAYARFHLHQAVTFTDERFRRMFESMMTADRAHIGVLLEAHIGFTGRGFRP